MKEKTTNKKLMIILLCVLLAAVAGLLVYIFYDPTPKMKKPFENLSKEQISKVVMCNNFGQPKAELDDKQTDEFIRLIREIETGDVTTDTEFDGFSSKTMTVVYTDGKEQALAPNGDMFTIDGVTYKSVYSECDALNELRRRVLENSP
ncbi:MAG: hypothetical protein II722_07715 [Ruminococcus sp.]|nr:hypothetical protein [Ruminococcus sp.]